MRKIIFVLLLIACYCTVAEAKIITSVDRANGATGNSAPIGAFDGNTDPLPTQAGGVMDGNYSYSDRTYVFVNTPTGTLGPLDQPLMGSEYIRTFNDDTDSGGAGVTYTVTISRKATVWISMDDRFNDDGVGAQQAAVDAATSSIAPAGTFQDTGLDLDIGDPASVYAAELDPGIYVFGANQTTYSMYLIGAVDALVEPAENPDPMSGEAVVTADVTVSWDPGSDPNGTITAHQLYTDAYNTNPADPNLYLEATITNDGERASYVLADLPTTKLVSWRVDEVYEKGVITGPVWNFQKELIAITQDPANALHWPGETATFSMAAIADPAETLLYQWYKDDVALVDGGDISGATTDTLVIANVEAADEGDYDCAVYTAATAETPYYTGQAWLALYRMIAHWTFDDDSLVGNQYLDATGTYPARVQGDTFVSETGVFGDAIKFNGTNNHLVLDNTALDPGMRFVYTNMCTVVAWIKTDALGLSGDNNAIISRRDGWQLSSAGSSRSNIRFRAHTSISGPTPVNDNTWRMVVGTFDRFSEKLYIDGKLDAEYTTAEPRDIAIDTRNTVWIGCNDRWPTVRRYYGWMDDLRIYNYPLTQDQIAQLYFEGTGELVCLNGGTLQSDLNRDCKVDLEDFSILASNWLTDNNYPL